MPAKRSLGAWPRRSRTSPGDHSPWSSTARSRGSRPSGLVPIDPAVPGRPRLRPRRRSRRSRRVRRHARTVSRQHSQAPPGGCAVLASIRLAAQEPSRRRAGDRPQLPRSGCLRPHPAPVVPLGKCRTAKNDVGLVGKDVGPSGVGDRLHLEFIDPDVAYQNVYSPRRGQPCVGGGPPATSYNAPTCRISSWPPPALNLPWR